MDLNGYFGPSDNWINLLVLIHVLTAVIGIGPTFFGHVLLRKGQSYGQLRNSVGLIPLLEKFPKILGSLAVVSGIALAWAGDYGFKHLWIYGSLAVYVLVQIIVIGFMAPAARKLVVKVMSSQDAPEQRISDDISSEVDKVNRINYVATCLGVVLFLLMFFKPTL
jgi:uncharacterized membrane protein